MITDEKEIIAHEAFIRRAAEINAPFMLKGSYVTRQYFDRPEDRIPNDLDWVCLEKFSDPNEAEKFFSNWAANVTAVEKNDGVKFRNFRENEFWRMIDYAMADDFPTVNTDILCWVDGRTCEFSLDLSFNLDIPASPVLLIYKPLRGEIFEVTQTVPLALQVSWKLHQTLVRPRFKDIFDLIHLLKNSEFNENVLEKALQALIAECKTDNIDIRNLEFILTDELEKLFAPDKINARWAMWRRRENYGGIKYLEWAHHITDVEKLPRDLDAFLIQFKNALTNAGLTLEKIKNLPSTYEETTLPLNQEKEPTFFDSLKDFFK